MSLREASNSNRVTSYTESIPFIVTIHVKILIPYSCSQALFFEQEKPALILVDRLLPLKVLLTQFCQQRLKVQTLQKVPVKRLEW